MDLSVKFYCNSYIHFVFISIYMHLYEFELEKLVHWYISIMLFDPREPFFHALTSRDDCTRVAKSGLIESQN
jgi:hypothetical protein